MTDTVQAPALGYSITANLGDDKQMVVQCFADSEEDLSSIHAKIDKAMAVMDRQKAKYKKADTLKIIADMEKGLRRLKADLVTSEKTFEAGQAELDAQLLECAKQRAGLQAAAHDAGHEAPRGGNGMKFSALQVEMNNINAKKKEAEDQRLVVIDQASTNIVRYEEEIAAAKTIVAECDALIEGS